MAMSSEPAERAHNPYLAARREWDERYGDLITRAKNWRALALVCALSTLVATGGLVRLSGQSRIVPFVVAVDSLGRTIAAGPADQASIADERFRRAEILRWVEDLRLVTTDGVAQRRAINRVYAHIATGTQAQAFISEFYRADPPNHRAQAETVSVEVKSVLRTSDRTYEVEWIETARDLYGTVKSQERWKGAFLIAVNPPTEEAQARVNPFGIYVTNASWSRVL